MPNARGFVLLLMLVIQSGCAAQPARDPVAAAPSRPVMAVESVSTTAPSEPNTNRSLDQIEPRPQLTASTAPSPSEAPLEAVRLFARARIALLDGNRVLAGQLLEQAIALDPQSFSPHKALGDLYASASDARSIEQWEKAAAIEPDHLDLQINLSRQAIDNGDFGKGIQHLRLSLMTRDYRRDDPAAAEADFLLARALQHEGYDRASLQMYERLLARLGKPRFAARLNPQVASLLTHPDALALHVAELYEKHKAYPAAMQLLTAVAKHLPANFEIRARLARDAAAAGDTQRAVQDAGALVVQFHADAKSLELLRDVAGGDSAAVLERLRKEKPDDRDLTCGLIDLLRSQNRLPEARKILSEAVTRWPDDLRLIRRQVDLLRSANDLKGAASAVVAALSARPDHLLELEPLWDYLSLPSPHGTLRLSDAQSLKVPAKDDSARQLLLARSAQLHHRDSLEREALQRATRARPVFAPAWRQMLALIWSDSARDETQKSTDSLTLATDAHAAGDDALAAELRGQALLNRGDARGAADEFAAAVKAGDRSAELYLNFAAALHGIEDDPGAQSLLWRVISDRPLCREAYIELYALYDKRQEHDQAARVLAVWLTADPDNTGAPRLVAREAFQGRRYTQAERLLLELLEQHDSDPQVLSAVVQFYSETGRLNELAPKLRQRMSDEPWNWSLAIALSDIFQQQHQSAEAIRLLDEVQSRAANDPDLLYTLSGLYTRLGQKDQSEQVLAHVLKLDPSYAGASNDLGYTWAEQGKNLGEAETLVRKALQLEPDNLSFLDSMGWVLYKRGKYPEALQKLTRAALLADPVVLDHLGDTLYRLGERAKAAVQWQQATQKIADLHEDDRDDLKQLREQLLRKQQQLDTGQPVGVAPVAEGE